jgi:hypothetical protein
MSKPSRNQPAFSRPLPLIRKLMRLARIPWPPELISETAGRVDRSGRQLGQLPERAAVERHVELTMAAFSTTCPTEDPSVTGTEAVARTWIDSAAVPNSSLMSSLASWPTCNTSPVIALVLKPADSAVTVYCPMGSREIV